MAVRCPVCLVVMVMRYLPYRHLGRDEERVDVNPSPQATTLYESTLAVEEVSKVRRGQRWWI